MRMTVLKVDDRVLTVLVLIAIAMQGLFLYRQSQRGVSSRPRDAVVAVPESTLIDLAGLPVMGQPNSKVIVIEFSDYECPFCIRHATGVLPALKEKFVSTGLVLYAFANNPLPIHPSARLLAAAAICAGRQGRYWEMHDELFTRSPRTSTQLTPIVERLQLNAEEFDECVSAESLHSPTIDRDVQNAQQSTVEGTPAFAVGLQESVGNATIHRVIVGAQPLTVFEAVIEEMF